MNRLSKVFQPVSVIPKNATIKYQNKTSKSHRLMLELGLIRSTSNHSYHVLPILQRSITKCANLIDFYMKQIDAQKMTMPILTSSELWKKSGRFETTNTPIMTTIDRHNKVQVLSPTHEESVTSLLSTIAPVSYKNFPLRLYQVGVKFRDELKPRFGLIRDREFIMKDLYTFDINTENALKTYEEVNDIYNNFFKEIGVPFIKVQADSGMMGGKLSHEYQYVTNIGEDQLTCCSNCNFSANKEVLKSTDLQCPKCGKDTMEIKEGIEIGHTFLLDDRYSKVLGATAIQSNGSTLPLVMGCYGIGVTRLVAAALEILSSDEAITWPFILAPYKIVIIPPKSGSKEQLHITGWEEDLYFKLNKLFVDDVIIDDRTQLTIGKRIFDAKRVGYPLIVVIGNKTSSSDNSKFELIELGKNKQSFLSNSELILEISKY